MRRNKNIVLALDPGTRHMGFAAFDAFELIDYGVRNVKGQSTVESMIDAVDRAVRRMISEKRPCALALEKNNFSQIQQNARLAMAISRIMAVARRSRVKVVELDPRTIRKVVCNDGNATKRELARIVAASYPEMRAYLESNRRWRERYYQNAFDAIACGLTFLSHSGSANRKRK